MNKIKKTKANGFYVFKGQVSADSSFIECIPEARQFLIYSNYYLKKYLKVYDYIICQDGWQMIVKLKSKEEIYSAYTNRKREGIEIWRIISEQVRKCLSSYVVHVNRRRGRSGSLVHSSYERFFFNSLAEANEEINKLRKRELKLGQKLNKYKGKKTHYEIPENLGKGSIFLGSDNYRKFSNKKVRFELENFENNELTEVVLSNLIKSSKKLHSNSENPYKNTKPVNSS